MIANNLGLALAVVAAGATGFGPAAIGIAVVAACRCCQQHFLAAVTGAAAIDVDNLVLVASMLLWQLCPSSSFGPVFCVLGFHAVGSGHDSISCPCWHCGCCRYCVGRYCWHRLSPLSVVSLLMALLSFFLLPVAGATVVDDVGAQVVVTGTTISAMLVLSLLLLVRSCSLLPLFESRLLL